MGGWKAYIRHLSGALIAASDYAVTMIIALFLFTATAIEFPSAMRDLLTFVKEIEDLIKAQHPSEALMLWADILLQPPLVVLILFGIATRLIFGLAYSAFNNGQFPSEPTTPA